MVNHIAIKTLKAIRDNNSLIEVQIGVEKVKVHYYSTRLLRCRILIATLFDSDSSHHRYVSMQTHFNANQLKVLQQYFFSFDTRGICVCVFVDKAL